MKSKKLLIIAAAAVLALLLTGCGGKEAAETKKETLPLGQALEKALPDYKDLVGYTADDLYDLMGIAPESYTEAMYLSGSDSLAGREIIAVRAKDGAALKDTVELLKAYLSQRMEETRNYLPEAYRLQSQAKVETKGLTAVLIVGEKAAEETRAFLSGE